MREIIFVTVEVVAYCVVLIPATIETLRNYRNKYPRFNEQQEENLTSIIEGKNGNIKTRSIE